MPDARDAMRIKSSACFSYSSFITFFRARRFISLDSVSSICCAFGEILRYSKFSLIILPKKESIVPISANGRLSISSRILSTSLAFSSFATSNSALMIFSRISVADAFVYDTTRISLTGTPFTTSSTIFLTMTDVFPLPAEAYTRTLPLASKTLICSFVHLVIFVRLLLDAAFDFAAVCKRHKVIGRRYFREAVADKPFVALVRTNILIIAVATRVF